MHRNDYVCTQLRYAHFFFKCRSMHISNCTYNNDADIGQDHGIQKMIFFIYVIVV